MRVKYELSLKIECSNQDEAMWYFVPIYPDISLEKVRDASIEIKLINATIIINIVAHSMSKLRGIVRSISRLLMVLRDLWDIALNAKDYKL